MPQHLHITVADQRPASARLRWLTLHAPELARSARPGQYILVRCAEAGSYDPFLRRPLFLAAAEESLSQVGVLYEPSDRGLAWLSHRGAGDVLDVIGPFGRPFELDRRTRALLLVGQGQGLSSLLLLAQQAAKRGTSVTLLAGAAEETLLPPPFLLPGDVEYQSVVGRAVDFLAPPQSQASTTNRKRSGKAAPSEVPAPPSLASLITWADQVCAALPNDQLAPLRDAVRAGRLRWERGFAHVLLEGPLICGVGACGACGVELRHGTRWLCSDGPVFDLRETGKE
jgi:dihydroorotate dehydrogenase electron transfer subunit